MTATGRDSRVTGANTRCPAVVSSETAKRYYYLGDGLGLTMKTTDSAGAVVNSYTYDV